MVINSILLESYLHSKGLTKSALSQKLGISSRTIAKIAKGEEIRINVIEKIAKFLDCNVEDISITNEILKMLRDEMLLGIPGGLYHETQIRLTYNSNHIEGSKLTEDQTRYIFETKTIGNLPKNTKLDDVIETYNHFNCIDYVISNAEKELSEAFILELHRLLKQNTEYSKTFGAGEFKKYPNTVGGIETTKPENVSKEIKTLLSKYFKITKKSLEDIVEFHYWFERIHPFQDGNGRVGRLIMFKECLKNNIVPFFIDDNFKTQYYNGLQNWNFEKGYLIETCLFGQDQYKKLLDYFRIKY